MCTQIAEQLGGECRLGNRVWSFDVLAIPEIRNVAASAAAMADLVVVSASGLHDLPDTVTEWVDMWLWLIDQGDPAMVLLLGADTRRGASLRGHLRHAAQQNRVPFFSSTLPLEPPSRSIRRSGLRSGMQSAA